MLRETQLTEIIAHFFVAWRWSFRKEHWLEALKATPKNKNYFFKGYLVCQQSDWIGSFFFKCVVISYYTGPNFLTVKLAIYFNQLSCTLLSFLWCLAEAEELCNECT